MSTSKLTVEITGFFPPPSNSPYQGGVSLTQRFKRANVAQGDANDQFNVLLLLDQQLAASGSFSVNLQTDEDRYGVALAANDVKIGYIATIEQDPTGDPAQGTLEVRPSSSNGWDSFIGSTGATDRGSLVLPYDSFVCFGCMRSDALVVDATTRSLDFVETGGANKVDVQAQFWLTR